jgi:predicted aldo/keto reductase-like oxidoreductase
VNEAADRVLLSIANDMAVAGSFNVVSRYTILGDGKRADACIGCGQCEMVCPQKIHVPEEMNRLAALMADQKTWEEICAERAAIAEAAKKKA